MGSVEKHGKGLLNEGAFSHKHLRWQLAMLCVGGCNALRWRLQCFALAVAMLCVSFSDFICILPCLVTIYTCFEL